MAETPKAAPGARSMRGTATPAAAAKTAPAAAAAKPAPAAAAKAEPAPAPAASEKESAAPAAVGKGEPTHGIRQIRVRGKLADGREFVSAGTFLMPVDPNAAAAKK